MNMIWATRGRTWGFRFLRDGGFSDPLIPYEAAFGNHMADSQVWLPGQDSLAVRFPDPLQRTDSAGRVISHDFVIYSPTAEVLTSFETARLRIWGEVSQDYADVWDLPSS